MGLLEILLRVLRALVVPEPAAKPPTREHAAIALGGRLVLVAVLAVLAVLGIIAALLLWVYLDRA